MIRALLIFALVFTAFGVVVPSPAEAGFGSSIRKAWKELRTSFKDEWHRTDDNLKKFRDKLFNYKSECKRKDDKARAAEKAYKDAVDYQEQMRDLVTIDKAEYQTQYFQKQQLHSQKRYLSAKKKFFDQRHKELKCDNLDGNPNIDVCRYNINPDRDFTTDLLKKVESRYGGVPDYNDFVDASSFPSNLQSSTRKFAVASGKVAAASNNLIYKSIDAKYCDQQKSGQKPSPRECRQLSWDEDSIFAVWDAQDELEEAKSDHADLKGELREVRINLDLVNSLLGDVGLSNDYYQGRFKNLGCKVLNGNPNKDVCNNDIILPKEYTEERMKRLEYLKSDLDEQEDDVEVEIQYAYSWWNRDRNLMAVSRRTEEFVEARNYHIDTKVSLQRCEDVK